MAQIGWIDFSAADRQKMKQALSLIRPEGQLDELGIGRIRDGLADRLFPGISTIQTRAKYFFIVPYILRDFAYLSSKEKSKTNAARYLEDTEHDIKNRLRSKYVGQNNTGIIGITLGIKERIARQPSEIYWVGLNSFGCLHNNGLSLSAFLRNLNYSNQAHTGNNKEEETDDDHDAGIDHHLQIKVPNVGLDWKDGIDIVLTLDEALFLKNNFSDPQNLKLQDSVLQYAFKEPSLLKAITNSNDFADFAWRVYSITALPAKLRNNIRLAHDFAQVIHGAHILYNHLLQSHFFSNEYDDQYLNEFIEWQAGLRGSMIDYQNFHVNDLGEWLSDARLFITKWWEFVQGNTINDLEPLLQLIRLREVTVKNKKARLRNNLNGFNELAPGKWIGLLPLQYRFRNAKRIINDILNPLENA